MIFLPLAFAFVFGAKGPLKKHRAPDYREPVLDPSVACYAVRGGSDPEAVALYAPTATAAWLNICHRRHQLSYARRPVGSSFLAIAGYQWVAPGLSFPQGKVFPSPGENKGEN
jgi:hypothetical protein